MTRLLSLDPSSRETGFAVFDGDKLLQAGVIHGGQASYGWRFALLERDLSELWCVWHFTEVAYEGGSWGKFKVPALQVAIQTIRSWCRQKSIHFYVYAPTAIKRGVTGSGRASKEEVARVIYLQFPDLPQGLSTHVTDSIAVGICHLGWQRIKAMEVRYD